MRTQVLGGRGREVGPVCISLQHPLRPLFSLCPLSCLQSSFSHTFPVSPLPLLAVFFKGVSRPSTLSSFTYNPLATPMFLLWGFRNSQAFSMPSHSCHVVFSIQKVPNSDSDLLAFRSLFRSFMCWFTHVFIIYENGEPTGSCLLTSNGCNAIYHTSHPTGPWQYSEPVSESLILLLLHVGVQTATHPLGTS